MTVGRTFCKDFRENFGVGFESFGKGWKGGNAFKQFSFRLIETGRVLLSSLPSERIHFVYRGSRDGWKIESVTLWTPIN